MNIEIENENEHWKWNEYWNWKQTRNEATKKTRKSCQWDTWHWKRIDVDTRELNLNGNWKRLANAQNCQAKAKRNNYLPSRSPALASVSTTTSLSLPPTTGSLGAAAASLPSDASLLSDAGSAALYAAAASGGAAVPGDVSVNCMCFVYKQNCMCFVYKQICMCFVFVFCLQTKLFVFWLCFGCVLVVFWLCFGQLPFGGSGFGVSLR